MSLASKLPYDHPYAGGYPGIGSQPLPSDGDALTYPPEAMSNPCM